MRIGTEYAGSVISIWSGPALPTGTLTFLFTDVEGSTRLWEAHPQAMRGVMARHDALLTQAFAQHQGIVVRPRGEGDSLFVVFIRASDAVAAALAAQRTLASEDWGEIGPLRVRMGLHTGEADLREGDYYGSAVNRCARIRAAGHGGQVLLSASTAKLVGGALPPGVTLHELGVHRLKDIAEPERLYQLGAADLRDAFPPLRTLDSRPHNLPLQLTSFIGREREVAEVTRRLQAARLVTLTGPGGAGKTRLAFQVAAELLDGFADGVFFVDLAPLRDPSLVPAAVAQALGVQGAPGGSIRDSVLRFLHEKHLLLVLDNCEHLLDAAEFVEALLQAAARLSLLVTSRAPLRVPGEREYALPPLPLPPATAATAALATNPAVALFVDRALAVRADFALRDDNALAVATICRHLDGLPLAIELAAARVRALPPTALVERLAQRLPLLTGGVRTAPIRQQTLRDTVAWSYALLSLEEQRLFRRLGVFADGCTLALAETVCNAAGDLGVDVLEGVSSLVEKSLVCEVDVPGGEPRYRLLETIGEFALGELAAGGDAERIGRQYATACLALAEAAGDALLTPDWALGRRRLSAERHNLRAVHAWAVAHQDADTALRLAGALWYWLPSDDGETIATGTAWVEQALALPGADGPTAGRASALRTIGNLRLLAADYLGARAALREAGTLFQALGRVRDLAETTLWLALTYPPASRTAAGLLAEALRLADAAGDDHMQAMARGYRALRAWQQGELAAARADWEACLALARRVTEPSLLHWALLNRAYVAVDQDDPAADAFVAEALVAVRSADGSPHELAQALALAAVHAVLAGRTTDAVAAAVEGLEAVLTFGARVAVDVWFLEVLACAWTAQDQALMPAATLLGAVARAQEDAAPARFQRMLGLVAHTQALLCAALGEAAFRAASVEGHRLNRREAIAMARDSATISVLTGSPPAPR